MGVGSRVTTAIHSGFSQEGKRPFPQSRLPWGCRVWRHNDSRCPCTKNEKRTKQAVGGATDLLRLTHNCAKSLLWAFPGLTDK